MDPGVDVCIKLQYNRFEGEVNEEESSAMMQTCQKSNIQILDKKRSRLQVKELLEKAQLLELKPSEEEKPESCDVAQLQWDMERKALKQQIRVQQELIQELQLRNQELEKMFSACMKCSANFSLMTRIGDESGKMIVPTSTPKLLSQLTPSEEETLSAIMGNNALHRAKNLNETNPKGFNYGTCRYANEKTHRKKDALQETCRGSLAARKEIVDLPDLEHQQPIGRHSTGKINFFTTKKKDLWNAVKGSLAAAALEDVVEESLVTIKDMHESPVTETHVT